MLPQSDAVTNFFKTRSKQELARPQKLEFFFIDGGNLKAQTLQKKPSFLKWNLELVSVSAVQIPVGTLVSHVGMLTIKFGSVFNMFSGVSSQLPISAWPSPGHCTCFWGVNQSMQGCSDKQVKFKS